MLILSVHLGTIYRLNIERWADSTGFSDIWTHGVAAMTADAWGILVLLGVGTTLGASLVLWGDDVFRKRRASKLRAESAFFCLQLGDSWQAPVRMTDMDNIDAWYCHRHGSSLTVCGAFQRSVKKAVISPGAEDKGVDWKEEVLTEKFFAIEVRGNMSPGSRLSFLFIQEESTNIRRQQEGAWNSAEYLPVLAGPRTNKDPDTI